MYNELKTLLDKLLATHSPGGWEEEMDALILEELGNGPGTIEQDPKGNIYLKIPGTEKRGKTVISAHKDEISVMVKKIDPDGKIWLEPVGGIRPHKYGEGPFDLLTESGVIPGVLHFGSTHCSELSSRVHKIKTEVTTWDLVYMDCKLDAAELAARGVNIGDRACVARSRKSPLYMEDKYVGGYALDDKAAVAILILLARKLAQTPPRVDTVLAFTSEEECGVVGAPYLSRKVDPEDFIALEVAPVADEYPFKMNALPVLLFKDSKHCYNKNLSRELIQAGKRAGLACQSAVVRCFGTDASKCGIAGLAARTACLAFPTENTHGFEVAELEGIQNCVTLLNEHLTGATSRRPTFSRTRSGSPGATPSRSTAKCGRGSRQPNGFLQTNDQAHEPKNVVES
jgi:putative aminopeptidase FrvX